MTDTALGGKIAAHFAVDMALAVTLGTSVPKDVVGFVASLVRHLLYKLQDFCSSIEQAPLVQNLGIMNTGAVECLDCIRIKQRSIRRHGILRQRDSIGLLQATADLVFQDHKYTAASQTGTDLTMATV